MRRDIRKDNVATGQSMSGQKCQPRKEMLIVWRGVGVGGGVEWGLGGGWVGGWGASVGGVGVGGQKQPANTEGSRQLPGRGKK